MKLWGKHLALTWFLSDKTKSTPKARPPLHLEELESRQACNSLFNPLFGSAFLSLEPLDAPYSVIAGDGSTSDSSSSDQGGGGGGGSSGETGSTQGGGTGSAPPPPNNYSPADPAAAISAIDWNASQFDSVFNDADAAFATKVADDIGVGPSAGAGVGAAVVIGLPGPTMGSATNSGGSQGGNANPPPVTSGPPPAVFPAPGAAPTVGVGLSSSQFGLDPFPLISGPMVSALTPFVVSSDMTVPAAVSNGGTTVTTGTDANGIGYTTTTTDSYSFGASLAQDSNSGSTYEETYSFTYDVQTVPAATGGASVHDWGASGYTFIANNDNGNYTFTLVAALTANETGSQTQTTTADDGSTNAATTTWQSESQYDRIITDTSAQTTAAATGSDTGGNVATQSSSTTGTYSRPITEGFSVGTVSGAQSSYSGQGISYQFAIQDSRDATGAVTQGGTQEDASGGYSGDWYSGSGSLSVASQSSNASSSGSGSTSSTADAAPAPSAWGGPNSPGATLTGGGVYTESGADSMGYGSSDQYTLGNDGSWQASSGASGSSGTGWTQWGYSGSGGYSYALSTESVSGTWQQGGGAETSYQTSASSTLGGSGWATTGIYVSGDGGGQYDSYQGTGSYAIDSAAASTSGSGSGSGGSDPSSSSDSGGVNAVTASPIPSASGGPYAADATFTGTGVVTESGSDSSGYADSSSSSLAPDGSWQPISGTGWTSASGSTQQAYSASGIYGYAIDGGSVSGSWQQSGSTNAGYTTTTNSTLGGDGTWITTGNYTSGDGGGENDSYSGSGNYAINSAASTSDSGSASGSVAPPSVSASVVPSASGGPIAPGAAFSGSGAITESASDSSDYADNSQYTLAPDGSWQGTAASSWVSASGLSKWGYSASGTYSYGIAGGSVSGSWDQSGSGGTGYNTTTNSTLGGNGAWTTTGNTTNSQSGGQHIDYSGSGSYAIAANVGAAAISGTGSVTESGSNVWGYGYSTQSTVGSDGLWQPATGSGSTTEIDSNLWGYSASGGYSRPLDDGATLNGTWLAAGGTNDGYTMQSPSTLNPDGSWTTTGVASSSGAGSGSWAYTGAGGLSASSTYGDSGNGGDSNLTLGVSETYSQGWSSQYNVQSTLSASGAVTTITNGSASGSASGNRGGSWTNTWDSWSSSGNFTAGNGSAAAVHASSGATIAETLQTQWQENYTITSLPGQATTTVGNASGSSHLTGDASWSGSSSGYTETAFTTSSGFGEASGSDDSGSSGAADHYDDQSSWSQNYAADGTITSQSSALNHVWGDFTWQGTFGSWWESYGSGSSSGSSSSSSESGSTSYDLDVDFLGFAGGFETGSPFDNGWKWGVGWAGAGRNGPSGPSAYSGLGYVFTPGDPVKVAAIDDQSDAEGQTVAVQVQASDWNAASGSSSGGGPIYSVDELPPGLSINAQTGLISGVIAAGDYGNGPSYDTTVTYTDASGYSASQSFTWLISDPVTLANPGPQSGPEGQSVSFSPDATDANPDNSGFTWSEQNLPTGLVLNSGTGQITGAPAAGSAGVYVVTLTATDAGGADDSQAFTWTVAAPITVTDPGTQSATEGAAFSLSMQSTDANGSPLLWSETGLPPGLSINANTGLISGAPAAGDAATGAFIVTITAADANGCSVNQTVVWSIAPAVAITNPGPQSSSEGAAVSLAVPAADSTSGTLTYSAAGLPPGLGVNAQTGQITGTIYSGDAASMPYNVTVTATDGTYSNSTTFGWDVSASPVAVTDPEQQTATEGNAISLQIQATGSALLYTAVGLPPGLKLNPTTGLISGVIAAGAAASGPYVTTVTATDANNFSASQTFQWNVAAVLTLADPTQQSSVEGAAVDLLLSSTDSVTGARSYTVSGLPAGLSINATTGEITGTILAGDAAAGPYTVSVAVTDGTYSDNQTFQWYVAVPVTMTDVGSQYNAEGDQVNLPVGATDAAGTLTFTATGLPTGLAINPSTGVISGTIAVGAASLQPYSVTVTAGDGVYSVSQTFSWAVDPAAPSSDMAALDMALASLAWPGQGGYGALVYQPAQDGPTFGDLLDRPGQADRPEMVPASAQIAPLAGGALVFCQAVEPPAEVEPNETVPVLPPYEDLDKEDIIWENYHRMLQRLRQIDPADADFLEHQLELRGDKTQKAALAEEKQAALNLAEKAHVPQKVIDSLLHDDEATLAQGTTAKPGDGIKYYGNLIVAADSYQKVDWIRKVAISLGIDESDLDQVIKDAKANKPLDPAPEVLKQLNAKYHYTEQLHAAQYLSNLADKEFYRQTELLKRQLDPLLHAPVCDCANPTLSKGYQVVEWVKTLAQNDPKKFKQMLSQAVDAAKFEAELCALVPDGTMVWIWTTADGTPHVGVQMGVGALPTGDIYNWRTERIALAFMKIDKTKVLPPRSRDRSTQLDDAGTNWLKTNGWDVDQRGHAIGGQFGGPGKLASGNVFPQDPGANSALGTGWEQPVGNLAKNNKTQADYHMCLLELFVYWDAKGIWDQRPAAEDYFLLQEGSPKHPLPKMPASYQPVLNPNNNLGNKTNAVLP